MVTAGCAPAETPPQRRSPKPTDSPTLLAAVPALVPPVAEGWGEKLMQGSVGLPLELPASADPVSRGGNALDITDGVLLSGVIKGEVAPDASLNIDLMPARWSRDPLHNYVGIGRAGPFEVLAPPDLGEIRLLAIVEDNQGVQAHGLSDVVTLGQEPVSGIRISLVDGEPRTWADPP